MEENRYATTEDAEFWNNVNVGDFLIFKGNANNGEAIFYAGSNEKVELGVGGKIHIYAAEYDFIVFDGVMCQSTESNPTIVTNLGGQVKWGYNESTTSANRTLELYNFDHVFLTGAYDPAAGTGDENFKGHNGGLDFRFDDYYEKYGLWGHPRWSGARFKGDFSNIVRIRNFTTVKISYVATTEGGFAGFNVKSDNPEDPERVKIDVQDCFAGWTEGEGFYLGYSTNASNNDLTELTFRNNIAVFNGAEAIQTDNLVENSVIENSIALSSGSFFRRPFQDLNQDGTQQFSIVEGGVQVKNNIMLGGDHLNPVRFKDPGAGRGNPDPSKKVEVLNNIYGFTRANVTYIWEGDGITEYLFDGNFYPGIPNTLLGDAYNEGKDPFFEGMFRVCNKTTPITITNNMFSEGRPIVEEKCGAAMVTESGNIREEPPLIEFVDFGFENDVDFRNFTFWSSNYSTSDRSGAIQYEVGDNVFYYDNDGLTRYYTCIESHAGNFDPNTSSDKWQEITWNGRRLPPMDVRLINGSFYADKQIGLSYMGAPFASVSDNSFDFGKVLLEESSSEIGYTLVGELLNDLTITIPDDIEISLDGGSNYVTETLTISPVDGIIEETILVRFSPTEEGLFSANLSHTSEGIDPIVIQLIGEGAKTLSSENSSQFTVYPVPTSSILKINNNEDSQMSIQIFDTSGKLVLTKGLDLGSNIISVDTLDNGIYYLKAKTDYSTFTRRIVISK